MSFHTWIRGRRRLALERPDSQMDPFPDRVYFMYPSGEKPIKKKNSEGDRMKVDHI